MNGRHRIMYMRDRLGRVHESRGANTHYVCINYSQQESRSRMRYVVLYAVQSSGQVPQRVGDAEWEKKGAPVDLRGWFCTKYRAAWQRRPATGATRREKKRKKGGNCCWCWKEQWEPDQRHGRSTAGCRISAGSHRMMVFLRPRRW